MKATILALLSALVLAIPAFATGDHSHEKKKAGPNGGRIIKVVEPNAEFFVAADRKVQITFLGTDGKAIAPAAQIVTVTAGDRSAPVKLTFIKSGDVLISEQALPEGDGFPTVVQIKATPEAKAAVEKFNLSLSKCPECKLDEYACICAH
ncbi:MAG TPA: hypothetical protein VIT91_15515 [Chthoniobacterales bacterium]